MSRIVAGRFENPLEADAALAELGHIGFRAGEHESFYVTPPGQHGTFPLGGDADSDAGAAKAGWGALAGASAGALAGAIIMAVVTGGQSLVPVLLGAGICAYVGSFIGSIAQSRHASSAEHTARSRSPAPRAPGATGRGATSIPANRSTHRF